MTAIKEKIPIVPTAEVPFADLQHVLKMYLFYDFGYMICFWSVKASFLCNYFNVRHSLSPIRLRALYAVSGFVFATFWLVAFTFLFYCRPINRYWSLDPKQYCSTGGNLALTIMITVSHVLADFAVIFLGLFVVSALQLGRRERYGLGFVFGLGFLTIITALVRFGIQIDYIQKKANGKGNGDVQPLYLATVAEIMGAVLAVSLPSTRVWLRRFLVDRRPDSHRKFGFLMGFSSSFLRDNNLVRHERETGKTADTASARSFKKKSNDLEGWENEGPNGPLSPPLSPGFTSAGSSSGPKGPEITGVAR
ncbi:Similar to hypothetical protein [Tuber melanosporum Mel28]; acc. no. XP_002836882 [Pyronema omphalodes CBS 100304]|uniref:Rhodopsin domain-containing protein n=1 Tax=Pyronema omphalodes (strain CBS 100304) TaxID=1076935 RepID=U4LR42_PYROM|nr:Similar to hypothetical protein [Tuber melanosporum Mel28]; acc. no. XP_002836882 [Pyronema omphalodes CBS 100304]